VDRGERQVKNKGHPFIEAVLRNIEPGLECEIKFHTERRWRADFGWPSLMILVEIEGGVWTNGRHTQGLGFVKDMEKYNAASSLGYTLLRYTPQDFKKNCGRVVEQIKGVIEERKRGNHASLP
jgi:very-short-patch-repair endonuclease